MHYKNKIYDITALEIFKRLEVFFYKGRSAQRQTIA